MDAQSDLGQSEDATISQIQPSIDVDSVHSTTAAAHVAAVLMRPRPAAGVYHGIQKNRVKRVATH